MLQGLSLAVAVWLANNAGATRDELAAAAAATAPRICVLGAGGCSVPAFLHHTLPTSSVDAVEPCGTVSYVARHMFGVDELERAGRFRLHLASATDYLEALQPPAAFDVVIVDIVAAEAAGGVDGVAAPPTQVLSGAAALAASLADGGVCAINTITSEGGFRSTRRLLRAALRDDVEIAVLKVPAEAVVIDQEWHTQRLVFMARQSRRATLEERSRERALSRAATAAALEHLPRLVDDEARWLAGWEEDV